VPAVAPLPPDVGTPPLPAAPPDAPDPPAPAPAVARDPAEPPVVSSGVPFDEHDWLTAIDKGMSSAR
jgi:hypothetical protein